MEKLLECLLKNILEDRSDLFGENCMFVEFRTDHEKVDWSAGYNSTSTSGRIAYHRNGIEHLSPPMALKMIPSTVPMKEFHVLTYQNEIYFYTRILPYFDAVRKITHLFPAYYSGLIEYNVKMERGAIVFENLQLTGYTPNPVKSFLDFDHLALMMRKVGEFHAYSYYLRKEDTRQFYSLSNSFSETNSAVLGKFSKVLCKLISRNVEVLALDPNYTSKISSIRKLVDSAAMLFTDVYTGNKRNPLVVLCHADYLSSNILFKYEQGKVIDLKIVDLATCRLCTPVIDLAPLLYLNADQKMRDQHWDDLIDEYYKALRDTFPTSEIPSKEEIVNEFKGNAFVAYFIALFFLPMLVARDQNLPTEKDLMPELYNHDGSLKQLSEEIFVESVPQIGGELATNALVDILKDMLNRGFI